MPEPQNLKIGTKNITKNKCKANYLYWLKKVNPTSISNPDIDSLIIISKKILPTHTFAYDYIKGIFDYNPKTNEFNPHAEGIIAKRFRKVGTVPEKHMKTSDELGHDVFLFSYWIQYRDCTYPRCMAFIFRCSDMSYHLANDLFKKEI